jgi:chromosome segregation ATPase
MKKAKKRSANGVRLPDRASELLINHRILWAVRDELKSDIRSHDKRFDSHDKRFDAHDKRFDAHDKRFDELDAKMDSIANRLSSEIQKVRSDIHRVIALVEEQNNRNRAVLDGYQSLYDRQDRVEEKVEQLEATILNFKKNSL